jgi:hypothetical protein
VGPQCGFHLRFLCGSGGGALLHVFMAICTASLEKCLFSSFAHSFIGLLILYWLVCWAPYVFCFLISCQMYSWQRFSPIL